MPESFNPNSSQFFYEWGKECALNNLSTNKVKEMVKEMVNITKQNKNDIKKGYKENKMEEKTLIFNILFSDLNEIAQEQLCELFDTTPEEENWEFIPIAIFERTIEEENRK